MSKPLFPFTAVTGQSDLKLGLILNAIHPGIGGILIRGEKGTAKSTIVRGLVDILPKIKVNNRCAFNCHPDSDILCSGCQGASLNQKPVFRPCPVITLPLNATEDRVAGGMDFDRAVKEGKKFLLPGLLASAHRGILYVDEINLLDDHIVDIILDAAASGENRVERESLSHNHPSQFILVGTMNPEEGDLRPQLLDRFGLCVEVSAEKDPEIRMDLMITREAYDHDPCKFNQEFILETRTLAQAIVTARKLFPRVRMPGHLRSFIAELVTSHHVAGHRADLVIEQVARAHASYMGNLEVSVEDISRVAHFALLHRQQDASPPSKDPPSPPSPKESDLDDSNQNKSDSDNRGQGNPDQEQTDGDQKDQDQNGQGQKKTEPEEGRKDEVSNLENQGENSNPGQDPSIQNFESNGSDQPSYDEALEHIYEIGATFKVKKITTSRDQKMRRGSGRRSRSRVFLKQGRYVKSGIKGAGNDVAFDATLRAAAPFQKHRDLLPGMCIHLKPEDIREKIREKRMGNFLLFLVDASGSMGAKGRMAASKGAVLSLLLDAYQKRDRVAMISFRKKTALVNLPPTASIELAAKYLEQMPVGGRTPLSAGLDKAFHMVGNLLLRDSAIRPIVLIITDGRSNVAMGTGNPVDEAMSMARHMGRDDRVKYIVVDTECQGLVQFGLARALAIAANAEYCKIDQLQANALVGLVQGKK